MAFLVRSPGNPFRRHAQFQPPDLCDLGGIHARLRVAQACQFVQHGGSQLLCTCCWPGTQQGLGFPCGGPLRVVGKVGGLSPHERAALSLWAQISIDHHRRIGPRPADQVAGQADEPGRGYLTIRARIIRDDEHGIDIGGIAQFTATPPAHADHSNLGCVHFVPRNLQCSVQSGSRQITERQTDRGDIGGSQHIGQRHPAQFGTPQCPHRCHG